MVKVDDANKSILIENYKEAVSAAQNIALREKSRNVELLARLDNTKILSKIFFYLS